jgi:hypothetical protein
VDRREGVLPCFRGGFPRPGSVLQMRNIPAFDLRKGGRTIRTADTYSTEP